MNNEVIGVAFLSACLGGGVAFALSSGLCSFFHRQEESHSQEQLGNALLKSENAEKSMLLSEQRIRSIIETTTEGFWAIDPATHLIIDANPALCEMLDYPKNMIIGRKPMDFADENGDRVFRDQATLIGTTNHRSYDATLVTKSGAKIYVRITATTLWEDPKSSVPSTAFAFISDRTQQKDHEDELYRFAHYDCLTGLPNRRFLTQHLEGLIGAKEPFGIICFDLDNFKVYNNTIGHSLGDRILQTIASELRKVIEGNGDLLARSVGDEFIIISRKNKVEILETGKKCLQAIASLPAVDNIDLYIDSSAGIVFSPDDGTTASQLLKNACTALNEAKTRGRGRLCCYSHDMGLINHKRLEIAHKLRKALDRKEFVIHYQPQVRLPGGDIVGVEALLRWKPHSGEFIPPDESIPVLEETGLIVPVGKWVLNTTCRQAAIWHRAGYSVRMSVNLSVRQFQESDLVTIVKGSLLSTSLDPSLLCLEITESLLLDNMAQATKRLIALTSLGVSLSIDDFGTGYSSLSYLQRLPINELKIDRAFVKDLPDKTGDTIIVRTIIAMAKSLGLATVAEGVETKEQAQALSQLGAEFAQGYYYSRPVEEKEITRHLKALSDSRKNEIRFHSVQESNAHDCLHTQPEAA